MSAASRAVELWPGRVRAAYTEAFGEDVVVDEGFGPVSVDVPADRWTEALLLARDGLDCPFLDFLTAVDEWRPPQVEEPAEEPEAVTEAEVVEAQEEAAADAEERSDTPPTT